ncbi:hypothetical protein ABAC402_04825 [Asticcacaulis sp. AC402]|nr:hypothetical protein ABAC402_04825 [Asticcacaulis sp. AC402]
MAGGESKVLNQGWTQINMDIRFHPELPAKQNQGKFETANDGE